MATIKMKCFLNAIILPPTEGEGSINPKTGKMRLPGVLLRWDRHVQLPDHIRIPLEEAQAADPTMKKGVPTVTLIPSINGAVIAKLLELQKEMATGKRFQIPVELEEEDVSFFADGKYLKITPDRVALKDVEPASAVWDVEGIDTTPEADALAAKYQEIQQKLIDAANAGTTVSPSGSPAGGPGADDDIPF